MPKLFINIKDLFCLNNVEIFEPDSINQFNHITIDSRSVKPGSLFIAIKGNNYDGHSFIDKAVSNGAAAIVINRENLSKLDRINIPIIAVDDTTMALGEIAALWRKKLKAKIIGITGSSGKTTTKEILGKLLREKFTVSSTIANNNNHIGVPLTLLAASEKDDFVVVEMGTNHFGEIDYTASIAKPDYSIITIIGASHLEFLISLEGVLKEKQAIFKHTDKKNGIVFLNNDDAFLSTLKKKYRNKITFGFSKGSSVNAEILNVQDDGRLKIRINSDKYKIETVIPLLGFQSAQNVLAASAVALYAGLSKKQLLSGIGKLMPSKQRLNLFEYKNTILIDDTYNANPESMNASISLLGTISKYKNKYVVLGDMFELGKRSEKFHKDLSKVVKSAGITHSFLIGKNMNALYNELIKKKLPVKYFRSRNQLSNHLSKINIEESSLLIKGSRGMAMEDFVKTLKERFE